jgi:hypothetical protein
LHNPILLCLLERQLAASPLYSGQSDVVVAAAPEGEDYLLREGWLDVINRSCGLRGGGGIVCLQVIKIIKYYMSNITE